MVKVIDIDLERRRISLSLKQANEGTIGEAVGGTFDPSLYGMAAQYDEDGDYIYPEGFDSETGEWLPGHEAAQAEWERQYAEAQARYEAHQEQVVEAQKAEAEAAAEHLVHLRGPGRGHAGERRAARRAARAPLRRHQQLAAPAIVRRPRRATAGAFGVFRASLLRMGPMYLVGLTGGIGAGK